MPFNLIKSKGNQNKFFITVLALVIASLMIFSFSVRTLNDHFLNELGISKTDADKKITNSILGGYLDAYGVKNAKNIALGKRTAVAMDLLNYVKQRVNTDAFKKEYAALRESHKPTENKIQTPDEMQKSNVDAIKKSIRELEDMLKKADENSKSIFENTLAESKKQLKEAERKDNPTILNYAKNYAALEQNNRQSNTLLLQEWEAAYPSNHLQFVKQRLQLFLTATKDIDYWAATTFKNGIRYFVKPEYESKGNQWKMAFRAGKEVIQPARTFVEQWLNEIK